MLPDQSGFALLWAEGDAVTRSVAMLLLAMSVLSWYLILGRIARWLAHRRDRQAVEAFWAARDLSAALAGLASRAPRSSFLALARQAAAAAEDSDRHTASSLAATLEREDYLTRSMRQSIAASAASLEAGLTALASIGATAPFIGLLGTVWGIYHALQRISLAGTASLDKVSGPVGEALIMTAAGLFVAIPAVIAYNAATRLNRVEFAALDAFAHDLHAFLSASGPPAPATQESP